MSSLIRRTIPRYLDLGLRSWLPGRCFLGTTNLGALHKVNSSVIHKAELVPKNRSLFVSWSDGSSSEFPFVWLRDNCQCAQCFHPDSLSRTVDLEKFNVDTSAIGLQMENGQEKLQLTWDDGHVSPYVPFWLRQRSFNPKHQEEAGRERYRRARITWDSSMQEKLPRASFQKILSDDKSLYEFLHNWEVYGLVLIKGAPLSMGQVRKVAERIAFIRRTHYGEEFSVIAKPNPSNVAYDAGPLQLHADLPYYQYKPGAELLHCIVQAEGSGGANTLVDGLHLAEMMRVQDPHSFNLLSSVHVDWSDIGVEDGEPFHKIHQAPILCLHPVTQELERINFSQPQRDSFFRIPLHIVEPWYRALKAFHAMAMDPSNCMTLKLNPGDMLAFDNIRILHGRKDFGTHLSRHIEGCYVDWDEVRSKSRVLEGALAS